MEFNITENSSVVVIEVKGGIIGGPDATELNERIRQLIENGKKKFVINLQQVDIINSSGLGILISNLIHVKNHGGDLCLCNLTPKVKQIMQMTKLVHFFKQFDSVEMAVKSYKV